MSGLSASEIDHLAKLARLALSETEKTKLSQELPKIVQFVEQLQKEKIGDYQRRKFFELNDLRPDEPGGNSLTPDQLAKMAPQWERNQVVVPPVFGGDDDA
jgi:aspartyl-tRNA(Asn)/glutamyl-tRNA(Gln) amidotransferase subunit C